MTLLQLQHKIQRTVTPEPRVTEWWFQYFHQLDLVHNLSEIAVSIRTTDDTISLNVTLTKFLGGEEH